MTTLEIYSGPFPVLGFDMRMSTVLCSDPKTTRIDLEKEYLQQVSYFSKILSVWSLQTLPIDRVSFIIGNFLNSLIRGGSLEAHVPNMEAMMVLYSHFRDTSDVQRLKEVNRLLFETNNGFPKRNVSFLTEDMLREMMSRSGFINIKSFTGKKEDRFMHQYSWLTDEIKVAGKLCPALSVILEGIRP